MFERFKNEIHPFINGINTYLCTSEGDISKLPRKDIEGTQILNVNDGRDKFNNAPCGHNSVAIVKGGNTYLLWPDNEWYPI